METIDMIVYVTTILFIFSLSYYFITLMQWYNYKIERVIFKHHKYKWHLYYFVIPLSLSSVLDSYLYILMYVIHLTGMFFWYKKLDKKLIFTQRVKRYFIITFGVFILLSLICLLFSICNQAVIIALTIVVSAISSHYYQKYIFKLYYDSAKQKVQTMPRLNIIVITGSYGKTSIKNFIVSLISKNLKVYSTPRSVNTLSGIIQDINNNLENDVDVYVVEAGAREIGDIDKISILLEHQYAVVGSIGEAHIEYFGSIENIIKTKLEVVNSPSLKKVFLINTLKENNLIPHNLSTTYFPSETKNIVSTLNGLEFELLINNEWYAFKSSVLGKVNITNIIAAINIAKEFNTPIHEIQENVKNLKSVEHRLSKIEANGKIIIDDSYNGNFDGMSEAIDLVSQYKGRKVIITPGLVESNIVLNTKIANKINDIFDIAIITGELNSKLLSNSINNPQKVILKDKDMMQNILASYTQSGDIILFANDAPNYI